MKQKQNGLKARSQLQNKLKKVKNISKISSIKNEDSLINKTLNPSGLRRSSRKSAINRRIWTEASEESIQAEKCNVGTSDNEISETNAKDPNLLPSVDDKMDEDLNCDKGGNIENSNITSSISDLNSSYDEGKEGLLIIEDEIDNLNYAVEDIVVQDDQTEVKIESMTAETSTISNQSLKGNNSTGISQNECSKSTPCSDDSKSEYSSLSKNSSKCDKLSRKNLDDVMSNQILTDSLSNKDTVSKKDLTSNHKNKDNPEPSEHVSLSEALAKLVSVESNLNDESETVTIHPFTSVESHKNKNSSQEIQSSNDSPSVSLSTSENQVSNHVSEIPASISSPMKNSSMNGENCGYTEEIQENIISKENMPPARSLEIRTPLKCSECPMRFCTVRSLLWHFGMHVSCLNPSRNGEALLQDLVVTWDQPDKPITTKNNFTSNLFSKTSTNLHRSFGDYSSDSLSSVQLPSLISTGRRSTSSLLECANSDVTSKVPMPSRNPINSNSFSSQFKSQSILNNFLLGESSSFRSECRLEKVGSLPKMKPCFFKKDFSCSSPNISLLTSSNDYKNIANNSAFNSRQSPDENLTSPPNVDEKIHVKSEEDLNSIDEGVTKITNREFCDSQKKNVEEKDLLQINPTLSLRIVSSDEDFQALKSQSFDEDSNGKPVRDSLIIVPQSKAGEENDRRDITASMPDILTIVPQRNGKNSYDVAPLLKTASGSVVTPSTDGNNLMLVLNQSNKTEENDPSDDSRCSDSEEGEMVIDTKDDSAATNPMDPLSLCSVSMEEEDVESISNHHCSEQFEKSLLGAILTSKSKGKSSKTGVIKLDSEEQKALEEKRYRERKYVCSYCQKRFGWSTDLKRHVILHTGERPFKCKWCPITFTRKFLLQNHMKKIHSHLCKWSDLWE